MTNEQNRIAELEAENLVLKMSLDMAEKEGAIDKEIMLALIGGINKQVKELAELREQTKQHNKQVADLKDFIEDRMSFYQDAHEKEQREWMATRFYAKRVAIRQIYRYMEDHLI